MPCLKYKSRRKLIQGASTTFEVIFRLFWTVFSSVLDRCNNNMMRLHFIVISLQKLNIKQPEYSASCMMSHSSRGLFLIDPSVTYYFLFKIKQTIATLTSFKKFEPCSLHPYSLTVSAVWQIALWLPVINLCNTVMLLIRRNYMMCSNPSTDLEQSHLNTVSVL